MGIGWSRPMWGEMLENVMCGRAAAYATAVVLLSGSVLADSLPDAMAAAYKNSKLLESSRALLRAQDESVPQALAAMRPQLTGVASAGSTLRRAPAMGSARRVTTTTLPATLQLAMELTIYDGGDTKIATEAARQGVLALRQSLLETEQAVLIGAAQAYHDVLRQRELLDLAENGQRLMETQLQAAMSRFELGEITRTDVSLVEASLAAARSRVFLRRGELEIAEKNYELATGAMPGSLEPTPPLPELPGSLKHAQEIAAQQHPAIKRAKHTVAAARQNLKRFETIDKPRVVFGSSVGTNRDLKSWSQGADSVSLSLTARMPFYQGGRISSQLRQTAANAEKSAIDLQREAELVAQGVAIAWARLEIAQSLIPANEQQVISAELAHLGMQQEAALGTRTTIDLLDSEQDLQEARTNLVSAINDRDMAVYSLLESVGLMTVSHLGLGIPDYDPEVNFKKVKDAPGVRRRQELIETILERTRVN